MLESLMVKPSVELTPTPEAPTRVPLASVPSTSSRVTVVALLL